MFVIPWLGSYKHLVENILLTGKNPKAECCIALLQDVGFEWPKALLRRSSLAAEPAAEPAVEPAAPLASEVQELAAEPAAEPAGAKIDFWQKCKTMVGLLTVHPPNDPRFPGKRLPITCHACNKVWDLEYKGCKTKYDQHMCGPVHIGKAAKFDAGQCLDA